MRKGILLKPEMITELDFSKMEKVYTQKGKDRLYYYNIPVSWDIESSSFYDDNGNKTAITYSHALNVDGYVFKMETWEQLTEAIAYLSHMADLDDRHRMIIYVHNLAYEFQFMKHHFNFTQVFSNGSERKILYAITDHGIEFRCSYMLSGSSLAYVANNLRTYEIDKMDGDLDYSLIRHPETPITEEEEQYILNDVLIIEYYIRESIEESGDITKIPLTSTGNVREYIRDKTLNGKGKPSSSYKKLMEQLTLESDEYLALRSAFAGGYTHGNIYKLNETHYDVTANDFASSYPARMISYQYPMGKGERYSVKDKDDFFMQINKYCCLFYVEFTDIKRKANEPYISKSKAVKTSNVRVNNGRIESADMVRIWMTEVDFISTIKSYDIGDYKIGTLYRYRKGYLPKLFVDGILKLYADKTELKGVKGKEEEYNRSKEMLNSLYGMCVMDIIQDSFEWDDVRKYSDKKDQSVSHLIQKSNNSRNRFLFYPWGVWITAYARFDLFDTIVKLGDDYLYADTDSIYYLNREKNQHIFDESNKRILNLLHKACDYHGYDYEVLSPKDPSGRPRTIGLWDFDGFYDRFKTLGAKRYMVQENNEINITVSGINKSVAVPYLMDKYNGDLDVIFEEFNEHLVIPEGYAGKSTHTYIEETRLGEVTDYLGNVYTYYEPSAIHLEETSYAMSISDELKEMIDWVWKENKTGQNPVSLKKLLV